MVTATRPIPPRPRRRRQSSLGSTSRPLRSRMNPCSATAARGPRSERHVSPGAFGPTWQATDEPRIARPTALPNGCENDGMAVRVFLLDDHELVRRGIRDLVWAEEDLTVVGEASTADEALERIPQTKPDVAVLDVRLGDAAGDRGGIEV